MKHWYSLDSENAKDHRFIRMKMVTMLIWVAETWNEVNKMGMQWSMGKKMMKEEMENSNVITCCFWQSHWWRNKGKTQKKMLPPKLYTIHAKHVTIILENIQIASQYTQWKSCKEENNNSIHGAELKQRRQENKTMKDEFSASYLTKKTEARRRKMNFLLTIWKRRQYPPKK